MPHKKNPVSAENITGIARVIRSHLSVAHENMSLWHERDISHSSAERMILPDNLGLTFYALRRMASTVENLVIHKDKIQRKPLSEFTYLSSYILHEVIKQGDEPRERIYPIIQKAAFEAKDSKEFMEAIREEYPDVKMPPLESLSAEALEKIYLKETDKIFERVFEAYPPIV